LRITIPISVGELLDKISILQIKSQHTDDPYVTKELRYLMGIAKEYDVYDQESIDKLLEVNSKLWEIEDTLREFEKNQTFDDEFIHNARMVYITNDKRSEIKLKINKCTHSEFIEIKIHRVNTFAK
jgi:hypothetical protein